ncbi:MAG: CpaF family protein [Deltaproteobacteria bacterium]
MSELLNKQLVGKSSSLLPFFQEEGISDILINGTGPMFIEKEGELKWVTNPFTSKESLQDLIERMVVPLGKRIDAAQPYLDGRLADGSRFHVILPPIAVEGPLISIRRRRGNQAFQLSEFGPSKVVEFLEKEMARGANLLIAGGTGAGKTSLLSCLLGLVSPHHRIAVLEETTEIQVEHPHLIHLEARPPSPEGKGEVTLQTLLKNALRMRPDRLVLGECRGAEAFDMLHAMNTGHRGSLGTIHANSALDALKRLEGLAMLAAFSIPLRTVKEWIGSSVHGVIYLEKNGGLRQVHEIISINGLEGEVYRVTPRYKL